MEVYSCSYCRYCEVNHLGGGSRHVQAAQSACTTNPRTEAETASPCVFIENANKVKREQQQK